MSGSHGRPALSSFGMVTGKRIIRVMLLALATISVLGGDCDSEPTGLTTGTLTVTVRVGAQLQSGATVQISGPGGTAQVQTDASGIARFEDLAAGQYEISTTLFFFNCSHATGNVQAGQAANVDVSCTFPTGTLTVTVRVGTLPQSGATVQISGGLGGTAEAQTDASGIARFENRLVGQYAISTTLANHSCPAATGAVQEGQTINVNVTCSIQPGSVSGQVMVNGVGEAGVTVELRSPLPDFGVIRTTTTVAGGTYQFLMVSPDPYAVTIIPPSGATCAPSFLDITVPPGGMATANFACTR